MSTIYCVHAAKSVGEAAMKASRATMDEALREAKFLVSSGHAYVWIEDERGNLTLPPAQVRARLDQSASALHRFAM